MNYRVKGFSLFELIVVIALFGALIIILSINYKSSFLTNSLSTSTYETSNTLRNASFYARDQKDNTSWGVKSDEPSSYYLLSGAQEDPKVVETKRIEPGVEFKAPFEIWFEKGTGYTTRSEIVIINRNGKESKIIVLPTGLIEETI